jgi:hypothetical protein
MAGFLFGEFFPAASFGAAGASLCIFATSLG